MRFLELFLRSVLVAWLVLAPLHALAEAEAAAKASKAPTARVFAALTPEQEEAFGNRADFFRRMPESYRPDLDWRSALSEAYADTEPQWSQGFEELIIRDFFADRKGGVYADVGCYKPKGLSTTYYLEDQLGWSGVAIDVMEHFGKAWAIHRPKAKFVHAAVSDTDGEILELHVAGPLASLEEDVIAGFGYADIAKTIKVETTTLDTIFENQGIEKIDFISIDIEGAALAGLRGFDIKRFRPELAGVETANRAPVIAYFESNGYELIDKYLKADKVNLYFRPKPVE